MPSEPARRGPGICAMRGNCGAASRWGQPLPCPDDGNATKLDNKLSSLLHSVCGPAYELPKEVCCTSEQVETLGTQLSVAAPLIAACPACINNFRSFYCDFTCSPDQSTFLEVKATQKSTDGKDIVKVVDYQVSEEFAKGFFHSCRSVQFGATNGFAMDLIGGGAKTPAAFLKYMGDVRPGLGSPFQIDFPLAKISNYTREPLSCSATDLNSRCACADCPSICPTLPKTPTHVQCKVGAVSCLTFSMLIIYSAMLALGILFYCVRQAKRIRQRRYERHALVDPPQSPTTTSHGVEGMVGRGQGGGGDDNDSGPSGSIHFRLGRGASLLDPMEHLQPKQNRINAALRRFFYRLGLMCARYPIQTLAIAAVVLTALNAGWKFFAVETDPVRLWVSPSSDAAKEKQFFDDNFGPFYRTEQIFLTAQHQVSPLSYDTLEWWLNIEREIEAMRTPKGTTLQDVCFAPSGPGTPCVVQSISAWLSSADKWADRVTKCAALPAECLPDFGQPIDPKLILGGVKNDDWVNAKALVITYVVNNYEEGDKRLKQTEDWENALERYLAKLSHPGLKISYTTGLSLEKQLNQSTNTDVKIVVLSYLVMFAYVGLTLGGGSVGKKEMAKQGKKLWKLMQLIAYICGLRAHRPNIKISDAVAAIPRLFFVNSRFALSLCGILIVLIAVSSSVGLFSYLGIRVTLIVAEVIPFLVLAVGVDNVFILVHELDRQNSLHAAPTAAPSAGDSDSDSDLDDDNSGHGHGHSRHSGHGHGGHGGHGHSHHTSTAAHTTDPPSPTPAPTTTAPATHEATNTALPPEERVARAVARMGPSILLSSTTEVAAFALGALVPMPAVRNFAIYAAGSVLIGAILQVTVFVSIMLLDLKRSEAGRMDCFPCVKVNKPIRLEDEGEGPIETLLTAIVRKYYAPFLLKEQVKHAVLSVFGAMFVIAIIGIQRMQLGLDQRLALPSDSYLVPYFNDVDKYLDVGPPVYFVVHDGGVEERPIQQSMCGRFTTCQELSVANTLEAERKRPKTSFLANPPASWIDDFLLWTNPAFDCCRVRKADPTVFCRARDSDRLCRPCFEGRDWDTTMVGLPEGPEFDSYLNQWLQTPADDNCPLGGLQGYSHAVTRTKNNSVKASHFRTFHTPLRSQQDYIDALASARRIANDMKTHMGLDVYPYSLFYVFFDQYSYIAKMSVQVLAIALVTVLVITSTLLGSWATGGCVTLAVALAVTNVMGVMGFWSVSLNAISLVNLVISLGIAVEFCSHLARAFMGAGTGLRYDKAEGRRERDDRAWTALVDVGPSIFSGITLTKLVGISVLALTKSKLLETYFFRMWLSLIVAGALHGLVLLPVLLSYVGGPGYSLEDTDEDWVTSQMRRPGDYESAPFADDDSMLDY